MDSSYTHGISPVPKIAVIGLEGSGKTVLIATLAKRLSVADGKGMFLSPRGAATLKYVEKTWALLQSGQWPPSTPPGEMFDLRWRLQKAGGNGCELRLLDVAGQDLRLIFGQEPSERQHALPEHLERLSAYCREADILLMLLNIRDFVGEKDRDRCIDNQAALYSALERLNEDGGKEVALIFTQYDLYEEAIKEYGGLNNFLIKEISYIYGAHVQFKPSMTMTVAAVSDTEVKVDESGNAYRAPKPGFTSKGFNGLTNWLEMVIDQHNVVVAEEPPSIDLPPTQPSPPAEKGFIERVMKYNYNIAIIGIIIMISFFFIALKPPLPPSRPKVLWEGRYVTGIFNNDTILTNKSSVALTNVQVQINYIRNGLRRTSTTSKLSKLDVEHSYRWVNDNSLSEEELKNSTWDVICDQNKP